MSYPIINTAILWQLKDGFRKTPHFNTVVQTPAAGRGISTISLMPYPTWDFQVALNYVVGSESVPTSVMALFTGLYILTNGGANFWLMNDINDNNVAYGNSALLNVTPGAAVPMGLTGDGTSTQFQLARQIGGSSGGWDIIQNLNGSATVKVNGTVTSVSVSSTGVVTFTSAPASGATLQWTGNFYFLCRFSDDSLPDLGRIGFNSSGGIWGVSGIKFSSVFI
jgi:hypothetical protein